MRVAPKEHTVFKSLSTVRSRIGAAALMMVLAGGASPARAQSLRDLMNNVVNAAMDQAMPDVLGPLITAANNADTIALSGLEIYAGQRRDRAMSDHVFAETPAERGRSIRQLKAIN